MTGWLVSLLSYLLLALTNKVFLFESCAGHIFLFLRTLVILQIARLFVLIASWGLFYSKN